MGEMLGLGLLTGLISFLVGLFIFIAIMSIWSNTGKSANYLFELVQYQRLDRGLDVKTGKAKQIDGKGK